MVQCCRRFSDVLQPCRCPHISDELKTLPGRCKCVFEAIGGVCELQTENPGVCVEGIDSETVLNTRIFILAREVALMFMQKAA